MQYVCIALFLSEVTIHCLMQATAFMIHICICLLIGDMIVRFRVSIIIGRYEDGTILPSLGVNA